MKRPGPLMAPMPVELSAVKYAASDEMEAYERLLTDAMKGDQLLFVRQDAVEARGRSSSPFSATAARCRSTNRGPGGRRTPANWQPISAAGTIRNSASGDSLCLTRRDFPRPQSAAALVWPS